ncbi:MAG: HlyD family efflux transporter periplasmic adaptor subunit [Saprospiraceae bacterium]|nr:HlyD family efflux transporter periplasmic adaptor subunit [Lewinella sp.]
MSNLITDPKDIRLREENEIQALLGHPPVWLTRWGITLVAIGVAVLLLIGTLLRYPDIVEAPASIETVYPPIRLEAKVDGRIQELLVAPGEKVSSGDLLAALQNPVAREDIILIETALDQLIPKIDNRSIGGELLPAGLHLGDLQESYSQLSRFLEAQQYRLNRDDIQQRIALYRKQIQQLPALDEVTKKEVITLKEEVALAEKNKDTYAQLLKEEAASELEFEQAQTDYLRVRRQLEAQERNLIQNQLEEQRLRNEIINLTRQQSDEVKNGWLELYQSAQQLRGAIDQWKDTYLIQAPLAGQVVLSRIWHVNQSVDKGQTVLTIDPSNGTSQIIARAQLPLARSGKVNPGDSVLLRLESYPYKEFGVLKGMVREITPLPESPEPGSLPVYQARIELTSPGLTTTNNKPIEFTQEMRAIARIITEDRSFLGRVLDEVLSLFRES